MKKIILFFIIMIIIKISYSQFPITNTFMPDVNDVIQYKEINLSLTDYSNTGANYVWDYKTLESSNWVADTFVSVLSTPVLYYFYFNNPILYPNYVATIAASQTDVSIPGVSLELTEIYNYFKENSSTFSQVGLAANVNGIPMSVKYDNIDVIYRFPTNFGNSDSSYSSYQIDVAGLGFYSKKQNRKNYCDGWGTLYLPTDTFNVMRIKTIITARDSVFITQYNLPVAFNSNITEYKWFAPNNRNPVLYVTETEITLGQSTKRVRYKSKPDQVNITEINSKDISIYPTITNNFVNISNKDNNNLTIKIITSEGKIIYSKSYKENIISLNFNNYKSGIYFIIINDGKTIRKEKIVKI